MSKICTVFTLVILCMLFVCCNKHTDDKIKTDKLLLDSLLQECNKVLHSPELFGRAQELEREALMRDNYLYAALAYNNMAMYYRFQRHNHDKIAVDSIKIYGQKAVTYFEKASKFERAIRTELDNLRWEIFLGNTEQTFTKLFNLMKKTDDLMDNRSKIEVYSVLGLAYLISNSPKEALDAFQTELQLLRELKNPGESFLITRYNTVFVSLANAAFNSKEYELTINYCDSCRYYLSIYSGDKDISDQLTGLDGIELYAQTKMKNMEKANVLFDKITTYYANEDRKEKNQVYYDVVTLMPHYLLAIKDYDNALNTLNEAIEYYDTNFKHSINLYDAKDLKAEILSAYGRFDEAFLLKQEVMAYKDSISQVNVTRQLSEMYTLFQVKELEKETIAGKTKSRNLLMISIFLIILCILLAIIVVVIRINYTRQRKKNEKIFEQYRNLHKYRKQIDDYNTSALSKEEDSTSKELSLYQKIEEYVIQSECYKQEDINREYLAMQIGTNREYLTRAIQEHANMTFNEYINHHRLVYASMLLSEKNKISIDNVYLAAGFKNKRTFYRLFKLKYEMTPKEFQNIAISDYKNAFIE